MDSIEAELLARCRQGDQRAWRDLWDFCFPFVYRIARLQGTPDAELDDLCQDCFETVSRKLDHFHEGQFTTWLYRVTANLVTRRNRNRRLFRRFTRFLGRTDNGIDPVSPDLSIEKDEAQRAVGLILERMAPRRREVFSMYEMEGLPTEHIAERLGCKPTTVWTTLHFARAQFREIARELGVAQEWEGT